MALFSVGFTLTVPHDDQIPTGVNHGAINEASLLVANYAADVWRAAVSGAMLPGMTRPVNDTDYAKSIRVTGDAESGYRIYTDYDGAAKIENGYASYDMKPAMLASPKAKRTKDGTGYYITVPFRAYTRRFSGDPGRTVIPPDILSYVRQNGHYDLIDTRGQRSKVPLFLYHDEPVGGIAYQAVSRGIDTPMLAPYTWRSGQFSGLTRVADKYGKVGYFTFRRISSRRLVRLPDGRMVWRGSDPAAWIHPGQAANPVSQAVEDFVAPQVEVMLERMGATR